MQFFNLYYWKIKATTGVSWYYTLAEISLRLYLQFYPEQDCKLGKKNFQI